MTKDAAPGAGDLRSARALADAASAVLEPIFTRLETLAAAVAEARRSARGGLTEADLGPTQAAIHEHLAADPMVAGMGFVAAPGVVGAQERFMSWWQRQGERVVRLRLNFDPSSIDVYDYLQMEWFQLAEAGRARVTYGPYVDYSGSDLYAITATVPVVVDGGFLGVAGADIVVADLERQLVGVLRRCPEDAVIVSPERRVIAANTPRWVVGSRLATMPDRDPATFTDTAELGLGNGWTASRATPR